MAGDLGGFQEIILLIRMRNKGRFVYVDELRKINTIEKMGYIESFYPETFEDTKQDNTKFIRYKEEIAPEIQSRKQHLLFNNDIITNQKKDAEPLCNHNFLLKNEELSKDIDYYHQWSQSLNHQIKERDYEHRFFFQKAQPPPRLKDEKDKKKEEEATSARNISGNNERQPGQVNEEDTNIDLPHRGKYNFHEITKHLYTREEEKDDKEGTFVRDAALKNELTEFRKLKNLEQIDRIGDFYQQFNKFNYYIELGADQYHIDFIDNSVAIGKNNIKLDYFREIGCPSRNILDFTIKNYRKMKLQDDDEAPGIESIYNHEKRDLLYLYFLKEDQLKINKNAINFNDLANISMGRITPLNAHMCVRNEKVTKAQYTKLLEKMEKYDMRQNEGGKPKEHKQVGTEELEDMNDFDNGNPLLGEMKASGIDIDKAIEEINLIKRQVKHLQDPSSKNIFDADNFNSEAFRKLQKLLGVLYDSVTDHMKVKYPMSQIRSHLHQIQGTTSLGYDKIRVLLFVADCYEEIFAKQNQTPNLRDIAFKEQREPAITKYKANKITAQNSIQTKKVYGFNVKAPPADRSISPLSKTPLKAQRVQPAVRTPLTKNRTGKQYQDSSTPIKMSATVRK